MRKVGALWPNPRPAPFSRERDRVRHLRVWIGGREGYVYWVICGASKTKEPGRSHHTTISAETALLVHFVYHVPKCAGRTIDRHLVTTLSPEQYCRVDRRRGLRRLVPRRDALTLNRAQYVKVVGGHFLGPWIEPFFAGRECRRSILLRDPVGQLVSHYNFLMMRCLRRGLQAYSLALAYRARPRNFITHYILRNFLGLPWVRVARFSDQEKYEVVNAFLARFWYVGDYSHCDDLIAALAVSLGIANQAAAQNSRAEWQDCVSWVPLDVEDLSSETIEQIRNENVIDQRLWESWHEAKHDTALVRPRALAGASSTGFFTSEASRFVNKLVRRIQRRWGLFKSLRASEGQDQICV